MIKEVNNNQKETKEIGFPKFMVGSKGNVIFAISTSRDGIYGVVVVKGEEKWPIGHFAVNWSPSCFSDYNEPITLQNITE